MGVYYVIWFPNHTFVAAKVDVPKAGFELVEYPP